MKIDIHRKPTTTDITNNYLSNHPMQHKLAAYGYYINRMLSLPLTKETQASEWNTIQTIAHNNNFPTKLVTNLKCQIQRNTSHQKPNKKGSKNSMKWTTFTYYSPKFKKLTNLFKYTDIKTAFKNNNTIPQLTRPKRPTTPKPITKVESTN